MKTTIDMYDIVDGGFSQPSSAAWGTIALILAIIGGILVYFLFLKNVLLVFDAASASRNSTYFSHTLGEGTP